VAYFAAGVPSDAPLWLATTSDAERILSAPYGEFNGFSKISRAGGW